MVACLETSELEVLSSPLQTYFGDLHSWLDDSPFQAVIAAAALVLGLFCLWDGPGSWRRLFVACVMAGSASVARYEAREWDLDLISEIMLMVQAAFSMALAVHVGFSGFQVLFGAVMGFTGAYSCGGWARSLGDNIPSLAFFWYFFGMIFGMLVFIIWKKPLLASAAPLLGAFLVVSSVCWLVTWGSSAAHGGEGGLPMLPPVGDPYVEAAAALIAPAGPAALAGHGTCTMLAAVIHGGNDARRLPAVMCLVSTVLVTMLATASGLGIDDSDLGARWWSSFGCLVWAPLAAAAAWWQMGEIDKDEGVDLQRDIYASFSNFNNNLNNFQDRLPVSPAAGGGLSPTARAFHGYMSGSSHGSAGGVGLGGLREVIGFARAAPSGSLGRSSPQAAEAAEDGPGRYVINQDPTYVSASLAVPQYDDEITDELHAGECVVVLEVRQSDGRVRARIKDPPGWISLVNLETGARLATRA